MKKESALSYAELLQLDSLIAFAQERGLSFDDKIKVNDDETEGVAAVHEAMWEARHGGIMLSEKDREIITKIRELAVQLEFSPTLGQLIQLRGEVLHKSHR